MFPDRHTVVSEPAFYDLPSAIERTGKHRSDRSYRNLVNEGGAGGKPMKALRVLVVDDDALIAMLLADMCAGMGHDVCAIEATEADAVAAAVRCRPDLMIVDERLRDGSGVSAVNQIHRTGFVPHVFISGDTSTVRALRPDAVALQKPFVESDLVRAIQCALGRCGRILKGQASPF
jgi:CheY-like chemotaxis protein